MGTGINAHQRFAELCIKYLSDNSGIEFKPTSDLFEGTSTQDTTVELSGQLKTISFGLMKICNDLRWMISGPLSGLGEITLRELQPGSSIMPGKVNPVIPEAVAMVCAQVIGNDTTITTAGQSGNFQLNVMLPVIAYNIDQSICLLTNACNSLANKVIKYFVVNEKRSSKNLIKNPVLITAFNPVIGYDQGSKIVKYALSNDISIKEAVMELTELDDKRLESLLDPQIMTKGGILK